MWRCPHCGAPQAETARCWVCRRSSTTCSTCRHFRASLTNDGGWCALDPKRRVLTGLEQRGCWEVRPSLGDEPAGPAHAAMRRGPRSRAELLEPDPGPARPPLEFVPVELVGSVPTRRDEEPAAPSPFVPPPPAPAPGRADDAWSERTSLFGEEG